MSVIKLNKNNGSSEDLMAKALDVDLDDSEEEEEGPVVPMDGMAYLKQVIKERQRIAETVTAEIDPDKIKVPSLAQLYSEGGRRSKPSVPSKFCPSLRWQNQQVSEFSDTRLKLARHIKLLKSEQHKPLKLPDRENEMLWCLFCYGNSTWAKISQLRKEMEEEDKEEHENKEEEEKEGSGEKEKLANPRLMEAVVAESEKGGTAPLLKVVTSMPVHLVEKVLEYQVSWLQTTGWQAEYGPWLYSLLSRVEKPLTPDLGSVLRDLVLFCSQERARLVMNCTDRDDISQDGNKDGAAERMNTQNGGSENISTQFEAEISAFNLFICLVAKYFDQGDLADSAN